MDVKEAIEILKEENCEWFGDRVSIATAVAIEALERTRWIPVSERLPELEDANSEYEVIAYNSKHNIVETQHYVNFEENKTLTHWMPLPEPPKDVEQL